MATPETPAINDGEYQLLRKILINTSLLSGGGGGGVTSIIAGAGISVDAATGDVTITNTGAGPGGANTYIQFNDSGSLGGDAKFTTDKTTGFWTLNHLSEPIAGSLFMNVPSGVSNAFIGGGDQNGAVIVGCDGSRGNGTAFISSSTGVYFKRNGVYGVTWGAGVAVNGFGQTIDAAISSDAAGSYRLGLADSATPSAQSLSVQDVVTGTLNTAGVDFTIKGSQGTGTGIGGSIKFQTAPASGSGSTPNALITRLTIDGAGATTVAGTFTATPVARTSGVAPYFTINAPADTAQTAATESPGVKLATATRTWATTGTVALQREVWLQGMTYASASASQTFTDIATLYVDKPIQGTNAVFTRAHSVVIVDSTSAASSITGGFVIATTLGTTATSVGIGGGNVNAGGTITGGTITSTGAFTASSTSTHTGAATFNSSATFNGTNALTAVTISNTARTSGVLPYLKIQTPADTGQTASTESPGIQHLTATRTWATTGTVATQREVLFSAPTYASASASQTFTKAATVAISGAPIQGTNAIITNSYALWVQAGLSQFDGNITTSAQLAVGSGSGFGVAASSSSWAVFGAGTTAVSSFRISTGVAPSSPVNGDVWFDGTNVKIQVGGATKTFTIT